MNYARAAYIALFALVVLLFMWSSFAGPLDEERYCVASPARDSDGTISRSGSVLHAFRKAHPCPATGIPYGSCPGWNIDHVIPLACGGCDAVSNLQWLPVQIKRCSDDACKDRWERTVYCKNHL